MSLDDQPAHENHEPTRSMIAGLNELKSTLTGLPWGYGIRSQHWWGRVELLVCILVDGGNLACDYREQYVGSSYTAVIVT